MDLRTNYLGFELPHPFVPGASPMVEDLAVVRRLEDAGAPMLVMYSLFQEQIVAEQMATFLGTETHVESFAEARSYIPETDRVRAGPDAYLEQLRRVKAAVSVPVVASLNGTSLGGWLEYAELLQSAGADALELNVYQLGATRDESGGAIEDRTVEILRTLKNSMQIPVAIKLSPFYTSLAHFASRLDQTRADGLVLFNRFYQPDIDVEALETRASLRLSDRSELLLRLRWLAILSAQLRTDLAVTGGIEDAVDAVKAVMCGARAVQVVSSLLRGGPEQLRTLRLDLARWLEEHEYDSLRQMQGTMNLAGCPDPAAYERANYMLVLQGWKG